MDVERIYVGGRWTAPQSDKRLRVVDPATEEAFGSAPRATPADARAAVRAARYAFDEGPWPRMRPAERAAALKRLDVEVSLRRQRLAELLVRETGCTRREIETVQLGPGLEYLTWALQRAASWNAERMPDHSGPPAVAATQVREPHGVVAALCARTEPFVQAVAAAAAALAAGNAIVIKPHPATPLSALVLAECAEAAQLPPGVVNVVTGTGREAGAELVGNPLVSLVLLHGTTPTGRRVAERAAARLAKAVLVLDGDSVAIVSEGADLDAAARWLASNGLRYAGQLARSPRVVLVHRDVAEPLTDRLLHHVKGFVVGSPSEWTTDLGPMRSAESRDRAQRSLSAATGAGASLLAGGGRPAGMERGYFLEATLLSTPPDASPPEVSGPVIVLRPVGSENEAVAVANRANAPVAAAVWARTIERANEIGSRVRAGVVSCNGAASSLWAVSGGWGHAGLGRYGGLAGLDEMSLIKQVSTGE